jgi:hypothetical protein
VLRKSLSLSGKARGKAFFRKQLFYPALKLYGFQTLAKLDLVHSTSGKYQLNRQAYKAILHLQKIWQGMTRLSEKDALLHSQHTLLCSSNVVFSESKSMQSRQNNLLFSGRLLLKLITLTDLSVVL